MGSYLGLTGREGDNGEGGLTGREGDDGEGGLTGREGDNGEGGLTGREGDDREGGLTGREGDDGEIWSPSPALLLITLIIPLSQSTLPPRGVDIVFAKESARMSLVSWTCG